MTDERSERPEVVEDDRFDGSKLMRIAAMTRAMLDEARDLPLDDAGRRRLSRIYRKSLDALDDILPDELRDELAEVFVPQIGDALPTTSELRMMQAQLVGWLEGLFNGIQAALASQQMAARSQLQQMRAPRRAIGSGDDGGEDRQPGSYL